MYIIKLVNNHHYIKIFAKKIILYLVVNVNIINYVQYKSLPGKKEIVTAYKEHPKNSINLLDTFTYTTSLIHNVHFQDDSTLLVSWSYPSNEKDRFNRYVFMYDVYKIVNSKLVLQGTYNQNKLDKKSEQTISKLGAKAFQVPREYYLCDDYMFCFSNDIPFNIFSNDIKNMKLSDYYKKLDDYFIDNSEKLSIIVYKIK